MLECAAKHVIETDQCVNIPNIKLIRQVNRNNELNTYESFYINKFKSNLLIDTDR